MTTHILIIEDNKDLASGLKGNLEIEGYSVEVAGTGNTGLERASQPGIDLIILDLMLPGMDGYEVLRSLREKDLQTPVLLLTARGEEVDKVRGLRLGADDYVTKPFGLMELLARVEALLRRSGDTRGADAARYRLADIEVCLSTREVTRAGKAVDLAPKEFDLLVELIRRNGAVSSRLELMRRVWGHGASVISRTVDTHIAELRRKLEADPSRPTLILTVRKAGYRLAVPAD